MKQTRFIILGILLLAASAAAQEYRGVTLELTIDNGQGLTQTLAAGIREGATSGLDPTLEEAELPPQPPNEIFDARLISTPGKSQLGLGSLSDYRSFPASNSTETYTISYQAGINASGVTLSWPDPLPGRITKLVIDGEDMSGQSSLETQFATGQFTVEISFNTATLSYQVSPNPLVFMVNNRQAAQSQQLTVSPQGDTDASWVLSTEAEWLTIEPSYGEGEQSVEVSVNNQQMPAGTYQTTILVRSEVYNAQADVDVRLEMTVGVGDVAVPGALWLGQNYPNPFNPSTVIELDLGAKAAGSPASLKVHDMLGREVMDLTNTIELRDGLQSIRVDAGTLPGGLYTYTLRSGGAVQTRTMLLVK